MMEHIAVVGAGYMGGGIAQVFAMAGLDVVIADTDPSLTVRHLDRLRQEAEDFENRGLFEPGSAELVRKNLRAADSVAEAVAEADLIEEAVFERPEVKGPVLRSIDSAARREAVIGSNTSTLPIGDLAAYLVHPERFLGIHFSNPAPFIPGVELIAHSGTNEDVIEAVEKLVPVTGKLTARVRDKAGFVLNRLQFVLLKEAINLVEEGVATLEDVDTIVRTTFGYRLPFFGPFAIADMAGLDDLPRRLPHFATPLRRADGGAQDAHRTGLGRALWGQARWRLRHPRWRPNSTGRLPQHRLCPAWATAQGTRSGAEGRRQMTSAPYSAEDWPIAAAMLPFGNKDSHGGAIHDAEPEEWAKHLRLVRHLGFTEVDPTDTWVRVGDLSPERLADFKSVLSDAGLTIPAISTSRRSVMDPEHGEEYLAYSHRVLDVAAELGVPLVNFGFFQEFTAEQRRALWFWLAEGWHDDETPEVRSRAAALIRELAEHAARNGQQISLEIYEDTYVGTCDQAVKFLEEVGHDACGLNPDIANLIRLHRPIEPVQDMLDKVLPYAKYWHVKNYLRDEDPTTGQVMSFPVPMEFGLINYRAAIRQALELGYRGAFLCEHYGSDAITVIGKNRAYIRDILSTLID